MQDSMTAPSCRVGLALGGRDAPEPYAPAAVRALIESAVRLSGHACADGGPLLSRMVKPGCSVLLKPNWVLHENMSGAGMDCMTTHPAFLLEALSLVLECGPSSVTIGDAPIQGCRWDRLVTEELRALVRERDPSGIVRIEDFRRTILSPRGLSSSVDRDSRPSGDFLLFDLGGDSLLEEISQPPGRFRVSRYDHRRLAATHSPGRHRYLLAREFFEAGVVLNLPKLKTHRKAGFTGAMKNLVGINGNKEYLPHHRAGGSESGGDCYPGRSVLMRMAERAMDRSNMTLGSRISVAWELAAVVLLRMHSPLRPVDMDGGWWGNDTVWRTILDINRIAAYGTAAGTMGDTPMRTVWSLTDAIVGGQGNGPLAPEPLQLGAVTFSGCPAASDRLHALLLGLDPGRIPFLAGAGSGNRWRLPCSDDVEVMTVDGPASPGVIAAMLPVRAGLPEGWRGACELG